MCPEFEFRTGCTILTTWRQWRPKGTVAVTVLHRTCRGFVEVSFTLFSVSNSKTNSNFAGENVTVSNFCVIGGTMCGDAVSSVERALAR
ncbi:hypothetical protein DPMN_191782 [Dreissena polymorpha]|uniref:Uncharacterized protein n=1 Tax=Dreissena polymorpha TaxID=45954 RepID=A0A9D3Y1D3_DREPO|nr:hypothetical protein DPMN_191782 [Dreissena polymorpha]